MYKYVCVLIAILSMSACSTVQRAEYDGSCDQAKTLKACKSLHGSAFNTFVDPALTAKSPMDFDGFVLSFDKSKYADYAEPKSEQLTHYSVVGTNGETIDFRNAKDAPNATLKERINKTFTTQRKNMFLADIRHNDENSELKYNITTTCRDKNYTQKQTYIDCSFLGLNQFENMLKSEIDRQATTGMPYTHVILLSTGWHNRQDASVRHFNEFFNNLDCSGNNKTDKNQTATYCSVEDNDKQNYRALYIGLTWPSDWSVKYISYMNKKSDADEMGLIWGNYLINKTVPTAIENTSQESKPKFVVVGHSFGARLVATAVNSKRYITSTKPDEPLETLILKQPAFSRTRLSKFKELVGRSNNNFYADLIENTDKVIVTASRRDNYFGNGIAFWSGGGTGHAGTARSYNATLKLVNEHPSTWGERFHLYRQSPNGLDNWPEHRAVNKPILYLRLDADGKDNDIVTGHNGIKSQDLTDVLYEFIK